MIWWVVLLKFVFSAIGMFFTFALILAIITSIVNPKIQLNENGEPEEMGDKARILFAVITSIAWAIVIAL